jgi:hypothetical protein
VPPNHDVAWYLYLAQQVLDGSVLYRDLFESNPPLIVWLSIPVAQLARYSGWLDVTLYRVILLLIVGFSILFASILLPGSRRDRLLFAFATAVALLILPGYDAGQREHLALILIVPWLSLAARHRSCLPVDRRLSVVVAAVGSLGLLLKPYYIAVWLALWHSSGRRFRSEDVTFVALLALYAGSILYLTPHYLPLIWLLRPAYVELYAKSPLMTLAQPQVGLFALSVAAWLAAQRPANAGSWLAVGAAFLIAAFAQGKGLPYQLYPVAACGLAALITLGEVSVWARAVSAVLLICLMLKGPTILGASRSDQPARACIPLIRAYASGKPILILSQSLRDGFPIVNETGARWAMGFPMAWVPVALRSMRDRSPVAMSPVEKFAFQHITRSFVSHRPVLLIVRSDIFDYLTYYRQDAAFDRTFRGYRLMSRLNGFDVYTPDSLISPRVREVP